GLPDSLSHSVHTRTGIGTAPSLLHQGQAPSELRATPVTPGNRRLWGLH
uniref:Uncharacterized protein n=1 Tax=Macaca fascicularis TaxID=9541 RepID=A0A7N9IBL7_MACFA